MENHLRMLRMIGLLGGIMVAWCSAALNAAETNAEREAFFENEVRPLLVKACAECHGGKKQESGLRLDSREAMLRGGDSGPAVKIDQLDSSLLLTVLSHEGDIQMPPGGKLPAAEIEILRKWVTSGAEWPASKEPSGNEGGLRSGEVTPEERQHWAFQPVVLPSVPAVKEGAWARTDIDRFVLQKMEAAKVEPVKDADKRTLIRRATFDLIGLPPTPDEMAAFLADESPQAFEKVIDRLLASPHYGERWGRHWLDVARYADTAGDGADYPIREVYKYRNYVINALNQDMPYDQFVREQIAGDILASQDPANPRFADQVVATGFIATTKRFGYNINTEFQHLDISDTLESLGRSLMGLSIGCARCHDHKYEPITAKDYYALYGIFASSNYSFPGGEEYQRPHNLVPLVNAAVVDERENVRKSKLAELDAEKEKLAMRRKQATDVFNFAGGVDLGFEEQKLDAPPGNPWFTAGPNKILAEAQSPFTHVHPVGTRGIRLAQGNVHEGVRQHFGPFTPDKQSHVYFNIDLRNVTAEEGGAYRLYWGHGALVTLAIECSIDAKGISIRNGDKWELVKAIETGAWYNLQLDLDLATRKLSGSVGRVGDMTEFKDFAFHPGWDGILDTFVSDGIGQTAGPFPVRDLDNLAWMTEPLAKIGAPAVEKVAPSEEALAAHRVELEKLDAEAKQLQVKRDAVAAESLYEVAYGVSEGKPMTARIQKRGEPSRPGDEVPRRFLDVLGAEPLPAEAAGSGRLELANWITRSSNPLTARVMVNRIWQQHFGRGLVATPSDFGVRGDKPSHPELLDYLAAQFMQDGWSMKRLHQAIMLSRVYQLSSDDDESNLAVDNANVFLWKHSPQALDAESIRDAMLAVSGKLDRQQPAGHPFPPVQQWGFTIHNPFHAVYDSPHRSVYLMIQRSRRHPFLMLFDAADPNISTAVRQPTITPTQALFLMNSPFVHEQADAFAARVQAEAVEESARIMRAYQITLGRAPDAEEMNRSGQFLAAYRAKLAGSDAAVADRGAWSALARVLMTSNEFLYVD